MFLSAYRRNAIPALDFSFTLENLESLLLANDSESLVRSVARFHPLFMQPLCICDQHRQETVGWFRENWRSFYDAVDETMLMEELTGVKDDGTESNKSSLKRTAKELDALRYSQFLQYLDENAYEDDDYVFAEPVLDWTTAKAFIGNIVLFQAYRWLVSEKLVDFNEMPTSDGCWVFGRTFRRRIGERAKQFGLNPPFGDLTSETGCEFAPLLSKYMHPEDRPCDASFKPGNRFLCNSRFFSFKDYSDVSDSSIAITVGTRATVMERSLYLTADPDRSEKEIARDFIRAVLLTTRDLKSEQGEPLGWEYNLAASAEQADKPEAKFHSQWAQLVYEVAFHPHDVKAAVCKNCGRPMLYQQIGKPRQFCRPGCKTSYSVAHRAGSND